MKRWFLTVLLAAIAMLYAFAPGQAEAYSYGDANTEDVAETFKLVETSLAGGANGWVDAEEAYKVRRSEISSHFGEPVAVTLDANFKARDSKLVVSNFKAVLVMNLDRRFHYAFEAVKDYAGAKLLLAKAKATFDTLAPYMSGDPSEIDKAFDAALDALGNPGLFGVGKKAVQPEAFKDKVDFIYSKVKPLFPYQATVSAPTPTEAPKPAETPAAIATPAPPVVQPSASNEPSAQPAVSIAPMASTNPTATPAASPSPSATPSATPAATSTPSATPAPTAAATATAPPNAAAATTSKPADVSAASSSTVKEAAAHAPMARTDKTNPLVSIFVIAGILILAGAGFWLARKKKWI